MKPVYALLAVRTGNQRMPRKCIADVVDRPVLSHIISRLRLAQTITQVILCTTQQPEDDVVAELGHDLGCKVHRGPVNDVAERLGQAVERFVPDSSCYIYRAMSDQPFFDWEQFDAHMRIVEARGWDFLLPLAWQEEPVYGAGVHAWSYRTWQAIRSGSSGEEREHVGMWLRRNLKRFDYGLVDLPHFYYRPYRLELDTPDDLLLVQMLYNAWQSQKGIKADAKNQPGLRWAISYLDRNPGVATVNAHVPEKTGPYTSFTAAEVRQWHRDYVNREIVFTDVPQLYGMIGAQSQQGEYRCTNCQGRLMALDIRGKNNLRTRCIRCGFERVFYAQKRK